MLTTKEITFKSIYLLLLLALALYLLFIRYLLIFSYSLDLDGGEYVSIHLTQLLFQGNIPYDKNPNEFPFLNVTYTPGYPYLLNYLASLCQYDPINDIHQLLVFARSLSFLAMLVNLFFIYLILKRFRLPLLYIATGIVFYLLLITGHFYATRPDCLKTTFFTISLYLAFEYLFHSGRKIHFALFLLFGMLAFCIKQDALINLFLLQGLFAWYLKNKKAIYLLLSFVCSLLVCALMFHLFFGNYFYVHTILSNFQIITEIKTSYNILAILMSIVRNLPLLFLVFLSCYDAFKKLKYKRLEYFISILSIVFFFTAHLSMLRTGSYLNYSFELILLLILNAVLFISKYDEYIQKYFKQYYLLISIYIFTLVISNRLIHSHTYNTKQEISLKEDYFLKLAERKSIRAIIKNDITFFPNPKFVVYYASASLMYGYDKHFSRMVENLLGLKIKTNLLFFSSDTYDCYFTEGKVKYIVSENTEAQKKHVKEYYPYYDFYQASKHFAIYRYHLNKSGISKQLLPL